MDLRLNHEDVAEFTYRLGKCARSYRVIALRKNISKARGGQVLLEENPLLLLLGPVRR